MSDPVSPCVLSHFAALRDPRQATRVLYPLDEILLLMLCATIAGADDFVEIGLWGSEHQEFLRRFDTEASRVSRRLLLVRGSPHERDDKQVFT